ncbi:hypothetical protein [Chitinophaga cymbidii]|uniref:hypothetical protein n=1 Tax=Chitinophaga cymbidii TaxID=1096750 RepID=UPI0011BF845E|nr:hypothetical protein [Chitinophaga cymbidii]
MKQAFLLASALVLLGGSVVFANGETKDKSKGKKPASTENTCTKPCPKPCPPVKCDKSKCGKE